MTATIRISDPADTTSGRAELHLIDPDDFDLGAGREYLHTATIAGVSVFEPPQTTRDSRFGHQDLFLVRGRRRFHLIRVWHIDGPRRFRFLTDLTTDRDGVASTEKAIASFVLDYDDGLIWDDRPDWVDTTVLGAFLARYGNDPTFRDVLARLDRRSAGFFPTADDATAGATADDATAGATT